MFDVTHSLQVPGGRSDSAGALSICIRIDACRDESVHWGLSESHPDPTQAKCDGPCALPLDKLESFLTQAKAIDDLVKGMDCRGLVTTLGNFRSVESPR